MWPRSLRGSLLLAISIMVIASGLLVATLVGQRYSASLQEALQAQARSLALGLALQAADLVLINDQVALQKMLDHQLQSDPAVAYLLLVRDGRVLAHTFPRGVPVQLLEGLGPGPDGRPRFQKIVSNQGGHFLDVAWPVLEGKAGVLRLGMSEEPYRQKLSHLWLQIGLLTLIILALALAAGLIFVGRITRPLAELSRAARRIDHGELAARAAVPGGRGEVAQLATSFNQMVQRIQGYTHKLEEQTMDLERAHRQTRASCAMVQEISGLRTLEEMRQFLMARVQSMLVCHHIVILALNQAKDTLFALGPDSGKRFRDPELLAAVKPMLAGEKQITYTRHNPFRPPLVPAEFADADRQGIIRLQQGPVEGALLVACPGGCDCNAEDIRSVGLILNQAAGALGRAIWDEEDLRGLAAAGATGFSGIIGRDPKMQVIYKLIQDVAPTDATVLIQGESGTGKELVARAIHRHSPRRDRTFMVINCSAYPETLLESELFGHEKGAFTGALRRKAGRFEQAHGGTVFLDEIGEISPQAQIKLLRVLQTHRLERLGGSETQEVDLRVLAATNKDLLAEVQAGRFREDLYYRLNVIPLMLPPLRDRRNDIPLLARHFLELFCQEQGKSLQGFGSEAMRLLLDYPWPGNVRELENSVEHAVVLAKAGQVGAWDLPAALRAPVAAPAATLAEQEKRLVREALEQCGWNKKMAAERLGISRSALYDKIKRHRLEKPVAH
ncbi:MAG: sigma 54-interacting transcriptional regulator [Thermodesulfobacteriota bacterium]